MLGDTGGPGPSQHHGPQRAAFGYPPLPLTRFCLPSQPPLIRSRSSGAGARKGPQYVIVALNCNQHWWGWVTSSDLGSATRPRCRSPGGWRRAARGRCHHCAGDGENNGSLLSLHLLVSQKCLQGGWGCPLAHAAASSGFSWVSRAEVARSAKVPWSHVPMVCAGAGQSPVGQDGSEG